VLRVQELGYTEVPHMKLLGLRPDNKAGCLQMAAAAVLLWSLSSELLKLDC
jgi:hypothetical protein